MAEKLGDGPRLAYDDLAPHRVPGTDLGLCIWVYGEGERSEPTRSVDATIEGEPIELTDDRKSGRCTL